MKLCSFVQDEQTVHSSGRQTSITCTSSSLILHLVQSDKDQRMSPVPHCLGDWLTCSRSYLIVLSLAYEPLCGNTLNAGTRLLDAILKRGIAYPTMLSFAQ